MNIELTQITEDDLDAVLEIERLSFTTPWSRRLFLDELANPNSRIVLAKDDMGVVLGYICFWIVVDEAHILKVVVHPAFRRQGIARRLLSHLLEYAEEKGVNCFALEVRHLNKAAMELYKGFGFEVAGVRKGYYADTGEDAVLMELRLP